MEDSIRKLNEILIGLYKENNDDIEGLENKILSALQYDCRDFENIVVTEVKLKFKNRPKYFKNIYIGQIFEIYLEKIQKYVYGVIVKGDLSIKKDDDVLIAYLNKFNHKPLSIDEIFHLISNKSFLMIANSGFYSIKNYRWKYVSHYSSVIFSIEELSKVHYAIKFMDNYYKSIGDSTKEIFECEKIEESEAKNILNPLGVVGDLEIEEMLCDFYIDNKC